MLAQQHVVAALGDLADRVGAARPHPERRMRFLRGRRLDDDVVELPIFAAMRERRFRDKGLGDHVERFLEALVGLLHRHAKAGKLVPAIAFADAEIEPPAGQQVEGRGLLGQQHRIVPRQHQYRRAEPQMPGARAEPGQQIEARRDLAKAGEMMLDQKRAVIAQRLGLDIIVDKVAKTLAAVGIGTGAPSLRAAEQSEFHLLSPHSERAHRQRSMQPRQDFFAQQLQGPGHRLRAGSARRNSARQGCRRGPAPRAIARGGRRPARGCR